MAIVTRWWQDEDDDNDNSDEMMTRQEWWHWWRGELSRDDDNIDEKNDDAKQDVQYDSFKTIYCTTIKMSNRKYKYTQEENDFIFWYSESTLPLAPDAEEKEEKE